VVLVPKDGGHLKLKSFIFSTFMLSALSLSAHAATITFTLTQDGCTGTCGTAPFGTITLTDNGSGSSAFVTVKETLATNERFAGTGAGDALEFSVAGAITLSNFSSGFGAGPGPDTASTFGTFLESATCTTCQGGNASNPPGPLSFNVSSATGVTVSSFIANAGGYFFSADIVGNNGNTGNVAAMAGTASAPEPASGLLVAAAFGLVGLYGARKRA